MMLFLEDTNYNHLPCGDPFFGGGKRVACTLSCCEVVTTPRPARRRRLPASFTDWMTTPDGVSRCRLAPLCLCDLVFTTPTGKGL